MSFHSRFHCCQSHLQLMCFSDQSVLTFLHSIFFSRYLITVILIFRLVQQVDVIPPSLKSLKFGRFLGCGEIPLGSLKLDNFSHWFLKMVLKVASIFRIPAACEGGSGDVLCHSGIVAGCP